MSGGGGRGDAAALLDELGPWGWAEAWVSSGVGCGRERERRARQVPGSGGCGLGGRAGVGSGFGLCSSVMGRDGGA